MPVFEPRTADEILRALVARVVATSSLSDLSEGSALTQILGSVANELASGERQMQVFRDSFYLEDVTGEDLDFRAQELPPSGLVRHPAQAASGGAPTFTRAGSTVAALLIPAGSQFGSTDNPGVVYQLLADVTLPIGVSTLQDGSIQAVTAGALGNAPANSIETILSGPTELTSFTNRATLSNGDDGEDDDAFRARCRAYVSSLGQSTPPAVTSMALNYVTDSDERASYVALFEDPATPGYAELLIDDGTQLKGRKRLGAAIGDTVGNDAPTLLFHEAPAVDPITTANLVVTRGGLPLAISEDDIISIPERGQLFITDGVLQPGDIWSISGYEVWLNLPKEIQEVIEGNRNSATNRTSFRPAGGRVRVVAPDRETIELKVYIIPVNGQDYNTVAQSVIDAIIEYMDTLLPGAPLYIARLIDRVMDDGTLRSVRFYAGGVGGLEPAPDYYPGTPRKVLRTDSASLSIVAQDQ